MPKLVDPNDMKCLACYEPLIDSHDFHPKCSRRIFGIGGSPELALEAADLERFAYAMIGRSEAVTGVQPKLSLGLARGTDGTNRLTIVGVYGVYILKTQTGAYPELPENEDLTMRLASAVGIHTATHSLVRLKSGELAYLTRRFDREKGKKIALEDLCQLTETLTEHKYRGSVERMAKVVGKWVEHPGLELQKLFERVLFSYLTGNADMHLKNHAIRQESGGAYALSPAFDLLNTKLAMPSDAEESALTINGKNARLRRSDFDCLASSLHIPEKALIPIYTKFENIFPIWQEEIRGSFLSAAKQTRYLEILQQRYSVMFA